jgi:putative ABC transport system permease protein
MSLAELARRVWFFLRRDRIATDLAEEMRLHVELRARREREAGFDATEAARRARRRFGNSTHLVRESRDQWGMRWAEDFVIDLRHGVRALRRAPLPSAIIVVTLAVGIGATLAMFTVMDAALFRPLPVRDPERLVVMPDRDVPLAGPRQPPPGPFDLPALRERHDLYEDVGAYAAGGLNLTGGLEPVHIQVGLVTPSVLRLLGVAPVRGRLFTEDEGRPDGADVVVLSHRLWRSQFGGDTSILGKRLSLNDHPYEIVGVMPPRFAFPEGSAAWIPLTIPLTSERAQVFRFFVETTNIARLAPGRTREQANAEYDAWRVSRGWKPRPGELNQPMRAFFIGDARPRLLMVMGLATLLLVAACANICGLLLTRWSARRREIAVRAAIGASRQRLLRQLATESAVLAASGTFLGLGVAVAGLRIFDALMPPELAALAPPVVDGRALVAMLILAIVAAIAIGTLPALTASSGDLTRTLKSAGASAAVRRGSGMLGRGLIVVEVALAVILLVGSGLLLKSLQRLHSVETGIDADHVATARIALSRAKYENVAARTAFFNGVGTELQREGGIRNFAFVSTLPLRGEWNPSVAFDLVDRPEIEHSPFAELIYASPQYFETMGIRLLAGRGLTPADTVATGGGALISDSLARAWWPNGSPLGVRISTAGGTERRTIVGIVTDVRGTALDGKRYPQLYLPFTGSRRATIVVRGELPPEQMFARLRAAVQRVDPAQVVYELKMMEDVAADSVAEQRTTSIVAAIFGGITLLLAALGLYGLLAFSVVQRTPELGIRFALGAHRSHVVGAVVGDGLLLTTLGAALGLAASFGLTRLLESQLFDVTPTDAMVYIGVPAVLLVTALIAAVLPAMKAATVDPIRVLRAE